MPSINSASITVVVFMTILCTGDSYAASWDELATALNDHDMVVEICGRGSLDLAIMEHYQQAAIAVMTDTVPSSSRVYVARLLLENRRDKLSNTAIVGLCGVVYNSAMKTDIRKAYSILEAYWYGLPDNINDETAFVIMSNGGWGLTRQMYYTAIAWRKRMSAFIFRNPNLWRPVQESKRITLQELGSE